MKTVRSVALLSSVLWLAGAGASAGEGELSAGTALEVDYHRSLRDELRSRAREPLRELDAKYEAAIIRLRDAARTAGKPAVEIAAEASLKEFRDSGVADGESDQPDLAKTEKIYLEQRSKAEKLVQPALAKAEKEYLNQLNRMVTELTKERRIDDALLVRSQAAQVAADLKKLQDAHAAPGAKQAPSPGAMPPSAVTILKATYGTSEKSADVTRKLSDLVANMKDFSANPTDLGVDPHPYKNKRLTIIYEKDGKRREQIRGENETVLYESFAGPQDVKELEAWLVGTRWRSEGETISFAARRRLASKDQAGEWQPDGMFFLDVTWAKGDRLRYQFDWKWRKFTEKGGEGRVFERID